MNHQIQRFLDLGWVFTLLKRGKKIPFGESKILTQNLNQITEHIDNGGNIGVECGASKLLVVDIDLYKPEVQEAFKSYPELPPTWIVNTPRGGKHYYYSIPEEYASTVINGIEYRCHGNHVVCPPSKIPEGSYEWSFETEYVTPAPSWLLAFLERWNEPVYQEWNPSTPKTQLYKLLEAGHHIQFPRDGGFIIRCPNIEQHTGQSTTETIYYPNNDTIHCKHAHCEGITRDRWISMLDNRPVIDINSPLHEMVHTIIDHLIRMPDVYRHGGSIGWYNASFHAWDKDTIPLMLSERFRIVKPSKETYVETRPPRDLINALVGLDHYHGERTIHQIVTRPRCDNQSGYVDGIMYEPDIVPIPTNCSPRESYQHLNDLIAEFPFERSLDRACAITAILAPWAYDKHHGFTPLFAFNATQQAAGKTLLTQIVSLIANGSMPSSILNNNRDLEAFNRSLYGHLNQGRDIVWFDNVTGIFGNDLLASILTSGRIAQKMLYDIRTASLDIRRSTWLVTGNSMMPTTDMLRRMVRINLSPNWDLGSPSPKHKIRNIIQHVLTNRAILIGHIHNILNMPIRQQPSDVASYTEFFSYFDALLASFNAPAPSEAIRELTSEGSLDDDTRWFLWSKLFTAFTENKFHSHEIIKLIQRDQELSDWARTQWRTVPTPEHIGRYFSKTGIYATHNGYKLVTKRSNGFRYYNFIKIESASTGTSAR